MSDKKGVVLTEEQLKRRKRRSLAIALVLAGLVALFYVVTIVKLGPNALRKTELAPITVLA
jgi:accessory gene regulator protein AgrB